MKLFFLVFLMLPAAQADQFFTSNAVTSWTLGPGEWGDPLAKEKCNKGDEAILLRFAERAAKLDCKKAGFRRCYVEDSFVTKNGKLTWEESGKKQGNGVAIPYGCLGEALVVGLEEVTCN